MTKTTYWVLSLLLLVTACGPKSEFNRARKLEQKQKFSAAWEKYQEFVAKRPDHPLAPEALFRAGWVAQKGLGDCYMSRTFYQKVRERYPQSEPWAQAALVQNMNCPDYFPLIPGSQWEEGDSDTKGGIARTETRCLKLKTEKKVLPSQAARLERTFYAGKKKFRTNEFVYKKENNQLLEYLSEKDSRAKPVMQWPLEVGAKWRAKLQGQFFNYEVISLNESVKVKAGIFENCLKIKSSIERSAGANFEYYAPGVGRVLTTLATKSGENRNTELLSYKIADFPEYGEDQQNKEEEKKDK